MTTERKLVPPRTGLGLLNRSGKRPGTKRLITRTFTEFAQATLNDPEVREALRKRVLLEIEGKRRFPPMHAVAVLAAAAVKEKPVQGREMSVTFIATITNGRGDVRRVELVNDEVVDAVEVPALPGQDDQAIDAEALPALPAPEGQ